MQYDFDLAVIGAGSGGFAAARAAAAEGLKVAVLEGGEEVGGLCILRGCMPTKALLYAAEVAHLSRMGPVWGIHPAPGTFDFAAVMARKDALIREFAEFRRDQLATGNFCFMRARATFAGPHTLALSTGKELTARKFIVATGSRIAPSPIPELAQTNYITSDDVLALKRLPESIIVLGGGAVATEAAQFLCRFGVKVVMIQRSEQILSEFDEDAARVLEGVLRREGIDLYTDTNITGAWNKGGRKGISFEHQGRKCQVEAEEILFALGRTADTGELGLEPIGVSTSRGRIITDATMQSTVPHIYAVGDCTGQHEIVHIAIAQAEIAAHNVAHPDKLKRIDYRLLTTVIFTDPQVAVVGLTEREAKIRSLSYRAASYPFSDHGKSLIMEAKDGFVKLLADDRTGEIVGGCCVGPLGGELIHEIIAAMHKRMTVHELAAMPHYHPTLAEIWTYPAEELAGTVRSGTVP